MVAAGGEFTPAGALKHVLMNNWKPLACGCASSVESSHVKLIYTTFNIILKVNKNGANDTRLLFITVGDAD